MGRFSEDDWFGEWLTAQERLQREVFEVEPFSEGIEYLRWNVLAAVTELVEVLNETNWKPWSTSAGVGLQADFVEELVDVLHFVGNLALWAGIRGPELTEKYQAKLEENARRQEART